MGKEGEESKTIGEHPPGMYFIGDLSYLLMDCETFEGIESTYYSNDYLPESIVDEEIYLTKLSTNDLRKDYECMLRIRNCETEEITDISFKSKLEMFKELRDFWNSDNFEFSLITKEGYSKSKKPDKYRTEINKKSKVVNKDFYYYNFFEYEYNFVENTFVVWAVRGDGYYMNKNGLLSFPVDSGTIGCCRVEDSVVNRIKTRPDRFETLYLAIHKGCVIELSASEREIFNPHSLDLLYQLGYFKYFEKSFKTKIIYSNDGEEKYFAIDDIYINLQKDDLLDEE